jgi:hypothetical protein
MTKRMTKRIDRPFAWRATAANRRNHRALTLMER